MTNDNLIITLSDNNKYTIVSRVLYENNDYIYLANIDTITDFIVGKLEGDEITIIKEEPLLSNLILKFAESVQENN